MFKFLSEFRTIFKDEYVPSGRKIGLSANRRFINDYLKLAAKTPSQPLARLCDLSAVAESRNQRTKRIGWTAIFVKAYAILADRNPELRYLFRSWPWPHLFDPQRQICRIAFSRIIDGEEGVIFYRLVNPHELSLEQIQEQIENAQTAAVEEIPIFSLHHSFCKLPGILRKLVWWMSLNASGATRASLIGTYGFTTVASLGETSIHPPTLGNMVMTTAPMQTDGKLRVTFVYDHRVHDGLKIARALSEFEEILREDIVPELRGYPGVQSLSHRQAG